MRRDIVEQFPGDICGESLGMPPTPLGPTHTRAHTLFSSSTERGHCCRQGPPMGDKKEAVVVSLQERWTPVSLSLFSFFFLCLTRFALTQGEVKRGEEREGKKRTMWRKERKLYCVLWRSTTPPITPPLLQHQPHPQQP